LERRKEGSRVVSYYESRIKALEARIEEMAQLERMKAVKVEAQLMVNIGELQVENTRLKAEVERLTKAGDAMAKHLDYGDFPISLEAWEAAKKGGQP
jgi:hypothetical protein